MHRITRLLLALIMFALFSISYLGSVSAQTKEGIDTFHEMYDTKPNDPFDHDAGGRAIDWYDSNTWPPHICYSRQHPGEGIECKNVDCGDNRGCATRDEQLKSEAAAAEERIHPTTCSNRVGALITPTQLNRAFKPGNRSVVDGGSNADHTAEVRNNLHSICADAIEPGKVDWDGHCATRVTNILKPGYQVGEIGPDTRQPPVLINSEWLKEAIALCNDWVEAGGKFPGLRRDDN
jgi:hypothetical protein